MQVIIDERINENIEKYFIDLGYEIIKIKKQEDIYSEISSHTDIFCVKIGNIIFSDESVLLDRIPKKYTVIHGDKVDKLYPKSCIYNICVVDNYAIHNFKITDSKVLKKLTDFGYNLIDVKQGYSRCSIIPLANKCCITSDKGIYNTLIKHGFDVLYLDQSEMDIKLFGEGRKYSNMNGFIGGCSSVLNDTIIFFGDLDKFKCKDKLINYIISKGYKIKDFKNMDVIDYGSCIFLD